MKKRKQEQRTIDDDLNELPEYLETLGGNMDDVLEREDDLNPDEVTENVEPNRTSEITEEDFYHFKDSMTEGNPWEE